METKKFEEFYSLCKRTVSRQRLLGAKDKDIAFVLTGMMATLPEDELTLEQHKKLVELVVGKRKPSVVKVLFTQTRNSKRDWKESRKALMRTRKRVIRMRDIRTLWDMSQLLRRKPIRQSS